MEEIYGRLKNAHDEMVRALILTDKPEYQIDPKDREEMHLIISKIQKCCKKFDPASSR